ncbi:MAG TPA: recombinase family protein [Bacteroidia bacterium]|jgi:DNA invertase Pin-like site-specific DNA recombinase|nr:recombinase family protein [Bacteroidia bacterium]
MNVIYIRTSTSEQTPELQLRDILPIVNGEYELFSETLSAWKENVKRPEFENVIKLIKTGKVKHLYAWDLDRLYRNRIKLKELFELAKLFGTTIHTANQQWLENIYKIPAPFNDIMSDLLINLFGWLGAEESKKKSERVKMSVRKDSKGVTRSHNGNRWGRKSFPKQTVTRVLELAKTGASVRQIAKQVNVYDKNKNERPISKSAVHKIIAENIAQN